MIRKWINLLENNILLEMAELGRIQKALEKEFWHCNEELPNSLEYKHRDDPKLGSYIINLSPSNEITTIDYINPLTSIFNTTLDTTGSFIKHLAEL